MNRHRSDWYQSLTLSNSEKEGASKWHIYQPLPSLSIRLWTPSSRWERRAGSAAGGGGPRHTRGKQMWAAQGGGLVQPDQERHRHSAMLCNCPPVSLQWSPCCLGPPMYPTVGPVVPRYRQPWSCIQQYLQPISTISGCTQNNKRINATYHHSYRIDIDMNI